MECKHGYYQYVNGELVCVVCGKLAKESKIEDKIAERPEAKRIVPKGVNKIGRPKGR